MNILFIHQNFPAQFKNLAPALAANPANKVLALTLRDGLPAQLHGIHVHQYKIARASTPAVHPWLADMEPKVIRGEACFLAARALREQGFYPDVVIAHPGWGESLFIKQVWPKTRLGLYCELFFQPDGMDVGFDSEFATNNADEEACVLHIKNANQLLHFQQAALGLSPTQWQASTFPPSFRERISVIHDGIDTELQKPDPQARLTVHSPSGPISLSPQDELITFVNRNLEPHRGYHIFMRALPSLLRKRPRARVLIVGGDKVSYGSAPKSGESWMQRFRTEAQSQMPEADWQRVHFIGTVPPAIFRAVLQCSSVHVYLSYPFFLSWSLIEAMSTGCTIVASDTAPIREAIVNDETGRLVDFFDHQKLSETVVELLDDRHQAARLAAAARQAAQARYDLLTICLPLQREWVQRLADHAN